MHVLQRQQGLTMISWLILLVPVAVFAYLLVLAVPVYFKAYEVGQSLVTVKNNDDVGPLTDYQIRSRIGRTLNVNYIDYPTAKQVSISGLPGHQTVSMHYTVRKHVLANLDLLFTFNPTVHMGGGG